MRKSTALLSLAIVLFMMLSAGCGKDTTRARNLMRGADKAWQKASVGIEGAVEANAMLVATAISGDPQRVKPEKFSELTGKIGLLIEQLGEVSRKYEKMGKRADIDEYVRYASLMKDAVDAHLVCMNLIKSFFQNLQPIFQSGDAVGLVNEINSADEKFKQIQEARERANKLLKKASTYKREKSLNG